MDLKLVLLVASLLWAALCSGVLGDLPSRPAGAWASSARRPRPHTRPASDSGSNAWGMGRGWHAL